MNADGITWTVERERGMSFELTALYEAEGRADALGGVKREVKPDPEPTFNDFPFGSSHAAARPVAATSPPSPSFRPLPSKRLLSESVAPRQPTCAKRKLEQSPPRSSASPELPTSSSRAHTRSQAARSSSPALSPPLHAKTRTSGGRARSDCGGSASRRRSGCVDTVALAAQLGLVEGRHLCGRRVGKSAAVYRVGAYTLEERAALVAKFHAKRGRRIWRKKIKYDCRKKLADKRPRLKGRFVTQEELDGLDAETLAKVTGLGPYEDSCSDAEAEDSDSSEGFTATVPHTRANPRLTGKPGGGGGGGGCYGGAPSHGEETRRSRSSKPASSSASRSSTRVRRQTSPVSLPAKKKACLARGNGLKPHGVPPLHPETHVGQSNVSMNACEVGGGIEVDADATGSRAGKNRADSMGAFDVMEVFASAVPGSEGAPMEFGGEPSGSADRSGKVDIDDVQMDVYDNPDLVPGFMVEDFLSNNFSVMPHHDTFSAGVTVN